MDYSDQLIESIFDELFPIFSSITGSGLCDSLDGLACYLPLEEQLPQLVELASSVDIKPFRIKHWSSLVNERLAA